MPLTLRPVTESDEIFLFNLYASTRKEELDTWGWDLAQRTAFLEQQFQAQRRSYQMQFPQAVHRIIIQDGDPIGRMMVFRSEHEIRLVDISVLPESRNAGIGTGLLQDLLNEASESGTPVRLQVLKANPAIRLYERLGFAVVGDDGLYLQMEATAEEHKDG
jgi:ribosomal protein S18 acetylase RimI-like enzyme